MRSFSTAKASAETITERASASRIGFFGCSDFVIKNVADASVHRCSRRFLEWGSVFTVVGALRPLPHLSPLSRTDENKQRSDNPARDHHREPGVERSCTLTQVAENFWADKSADARGAVDEANCRRSCCAREECGW